MSGLILSDFIMKTVAVEYVHLSDNHRPALSAWSAPVIRKHSLHWSVSSPWHPYFICSYWQNISYMRVIRQGHYRRPKFGFLRFFVKPLFYVVQIAYGSHLVSHSKDTGDSFLWEKAAGTWSTPFTSKYTFQIFLDQPPPCTETTASSPSDPPSQYPSPPYCVFPLFLSSRLANLFTAILLMLSTNENRFGLDSGVADPSMAFRCHFFLLCSVWLEPCINLPFGFYTLNAWQMATSERVIDAVMGTYVFDRAHVCSAHG